MPSTTSKLIAFATTFALAQAIRARTLKFTRDDDDDDSGGGGGGDDSGDLTSAHGAVACIAWLVLVIGAILMHVLNGPKTWLIHAGTQALGILLFVVGAGMGIYVATTTKQLDAAHAIIGLVLFATVWFVAAGGMLQHLAFRKHQRRTIIGHVHRWLGISLITLAFINGGLGLQLAGEHGGKVVAYAVIAAVVWLAWMAITFFWPNKGKREV